MKIELFCHPVFAFLTVHRNNSSLFFDYYWDLSAVWLPNTLFKHGGRFVSHALNTYNIGRTKVHNP